MRALYIMEYNEAAIELARMGPRPTREQIFHSARFSNKSFTMMYQMLRRLNLERIVRDGNNDAR